jgi:hypothetical protein
MENHQCRAPDTVYQRRPKPGVRTSSEKLQVGLALCTRFVELIDMGCSSRVKNRISDIIYGLWHAKVFDQGFEDANKL